MAHHEGEPSLMVVHSPLALSMTFIITDQSAQFVVVSSGNYPLTSLIIHARAAL
jgi:hypothetical protein